MKSYLLLRDNKQSGPHSFDEMVSKGLKAYDLVWVEGKSAAWRYPGELEEFKPFAPPVEEQPFDRFFKRPSQQQNTQIKETNSATASSAKVEKKEAAALSGFAEVEKAAEKKEPVKEKVSLPKFPKYVSVSLPAGRNNMTNVVVVKKQELPAEERKKVPEQETAAEAYKKIIAEEKKQSAIGDAKTPFYQPGEAQESFHEIREKQFVQPTREQQRRTPLIQAIAIAAAILSLVAVGVLIGMSIAGDSSQKNGSVDPQKVSTTPSNSGEGNIEAPLNNDLVHTSVQQQSIPIKEEANPVADKTILPESKKKKPVNPELKSEKQDDSTQPEKVISVPVVPDKTENVANPESGEKESARKNIVQLVSLDVNTYKIGMFGGISDLQLTVNNNSSYPVDLVVVEVRYIQSNKKVFKTETLHFRNIGANSFMSIDAPKTNKGIKVESKITYITSKDLDLSYNVW